ncbi:hypothetical protein BD779DRAFT_1471766 [Infundibulicybe gibba]|nr:hypothetical protein BD779DRAFT_1471766 [Infundibulicybe gibba]
MNRLSFTPQARQEIDNLDLKNLAKTTSKAFERLAPWCQLQAVDSSPEAASLITKIVDRIYVYMRAFDSADLAVQLAFQLASDAMVLCYLIDEEGSPAERQESLDGLVALAGQGHTNAQQASDAFREVRQALYKVAAQTKDNESLVEVPIDPGQATALRKPLKEVGSDLVASVKLMEQFYATVTDLTKWWNGMKTELLAAKTSSTLIPLDVSNPSRNQSTYNQWNKLQKECAGYRSALADLHEGFQDLLPLSTEAWNKVLPLSASESAAAVETSKRKRKNTLIGKVFSKIPGKIHKRKDSSSVAEDSSSVHASETGTADSAKAPGSDRKSFGLKGIVSSLRRKKAPERQGADTGSVSSQQNSVREKLSTELPISSDKGKGKAIEVDTVPERVSKEWVPLDTAKAPSVVLPEEMKEGSVVEKEEPVKQEPTDPEKVTELPEVHEEQQVGYISEKPELDTKENEPLLSKSPSKVSLSPVAVPNEVAEASTPTPAEPVVEPATQEKPNANPKVVEMDDTIPDNAATRWICSSCILM